MLDYMTDIMEGSQDFGWPSAILAHTLILCCMEEGKVNWLISEKLDILRRARAHKFDQPLKFTIQKLLMAGWTVKV